MPGMPRPNTSTFSIARHGSKSCPFGTRAAVEAAAAHREAMLAGDKREGSSASWAKVKFDRQIVAIAKVEGRDPTSIPTMTTLPGIQ